MPENRLIKFNLINVKPLRKEEMKGNLINHIYGKTENTTANTTFTTERLDAPPKIRRRGGCQFSALPPDTVLKSQPVHGGEERKETACGSEHEQNCSFADDLLVYKVPRNPQTPMGNTN